jgi:hypothetical protein
MGFIRAVRAVLRVLLVGRAAMAAENLAMRHQLNVLRRSVIPRHGRLCQLQASMTFSKRPVS